MSSKYSSMMSISSRLAMEENSNFFGKKIFNHIFEDFFERLHAYEIFGENFFFENDESSEIPLFFVCLISSTT